MSDRTPPAILPLLVENLPLADLAPYPHCVTWDPVWRDGAENKPSGWTKVPKNPRTGTNAQSNNPTTWSTAGDVLTRFDRFGYVVAENDPFTFLDVDNAIGAAGEIKPWAQEIVDRFPHGYWERSTTGTGLKGLIRGRSAEARPDGRTRNHGKILIGDGKLEIFFWGKFTALTGNRLESSAASIGDGQGALDTLVADLCPELAPQPVSPLPSLDLDDRDVIERTLRMVKGRRLHEAGDISDYPSQSEADLALLDYYVLAGATDAEQLDRLFRSSALMRDKWDRPDYLRSTITKALDGKVVPYVPATLVRSASASKNGVVVGNPQDADSPFAAPEPLAATGTDGLPDDIPSLKQIIRDLTRRAEVAERRAQAAEQKAEMLSRVQSTTARILQNKALGQERFTAVALTHRFANLQAAGDPGDRGLYPITLKSVGEAAGVSEDAASRHIGKLVDAGVLHKKLRWIPPGVDPETGEITNGHKRQYIGPAATNVIDFVEAVAALQPVKPKTWGGRIDRCRPCTEHPNAGVIKRVTFHCAACDQVLVQLPDKPYERSEADPQDADYAAADPGAADTSPAVATPLLSRVARVSDNGADFGERAVTVKPVSRTLVARGVPTDTRVQSGRCLDCGADIAAGSFYCARHGGPPPLDHCTDVAHSARA